MLRAIALAVAVAVAAPGLALSDDVPPACTSMVKAIGVPRVVKRLDREILCRHGYVLSHDNDRKTPNWVVERLTPDRFEGPGDRKAQGDPFATDPDIEKGKRAELIDYRDKSTQGRRFDRGHMAPAASMKFSEQAMAESFLLSNMAPQQGTGLNRHIWADLEALVRDWTCERGELYVITGPIYDNDTPDALGPNNVAVPTAFFKIVVDAQAKRVIAFILPNEKVDKNGQRAWDALKPFIATVRQVEERAGLQVLSGMGLRERKRLGSLRSVMWPVRQGCAH
jgi:endonuclease G